MLREPGPSVFARHQNARPTDSTEKGLLPSSLATMDQHGQDKLKMTPPVTSGEAEGCRMSPVGNYPRNLAEGAALPVYH